jgi:hypothetical protein
MQRVIRQLSCFVVLFGTVLVVVADVQGDESNRIDFNRDIRPILAGKCFTCHGPDGQQRQAGLRLDLREGATAELDSGTQAVVSGRPEQSELIARVTSDDDGLRMPPAEAGKELSDREVKLLTEWIRQGAHYARHWSYVKPDRPPVPNAAAVIQSGKLPAQADSPVLNKLKSWSRNEIDNFLLERMLREGLLPSPEADRYALIRRASLDLTGLPPTLEEVERFVGDPDPEVYEKLIDRLLAKKAYGEHWARKWLDLARYADSAGYADDPARTIWAYRDWVIRAINDNRPFDQFTIEQLAGDLLPDPTDDQLIATAFHRNTLTNNEGGTSDEEFRNVAVVDRVDTTMAVWMGTTMGCAQCHTHKYDPISQEEYFRFFAIFNNTADADRRDESPLLEIYTDQQKQQKADWQAEIARLENTLSTPTPELLDSQRRWEQNFAGDLAWQSLRPAEIQSKQKAPTSILDDDSILIGEARKTDVYTLKLPLSSAISSSSTGVDTENRQANLTALRIETLPHESLPGNGTGFGGGNFVVTRVLASLTPPEDQRPAGRYVRIELPGPQKILSLAEVQVFSGNQNVTLQGEARQSSTAFDGPAKLAIDGKTDGNYQAGSTTHTATESDPWWEVDLRFTRPVDRIVVWNRTDNGLHTRLAGFRIKLLDEHRKPVWETKPVTTPQPNGEFPISNSRPIALAAAFADYSQSGFEAAGVLDGEKPNQSGWAIGGQTDRPHTLTLIPKEPFSASPGDTLTITLEQLSQHENHTLGRFRLSVSDDVRAAEFARTPPNIAAIARKPAAERDEVQQAELTQFYLAEIAPELQKERTRLAEVQKQLAAMKPTTTVPVMREMPADGRRTTRIQFRGNFLDTGDEVTEGVPAAFHPLSGSEPLDRLRLAHWLMDEDNPLTARVAANRYWDAIFGRGLVVTSEEFGSQGEPPTHPELLDWLATELVRLNWDTKAFVKLIVTSAAYRQSSRVTPELLEHDPENVLLARGPRIRLSAEMIRDQALFVGGLLSTKMYGPPVRPPQPSLGLTAAFGSAVDWQPSEGEDRYRRGLYTTWRRSSPYPSMAAFDAPNREVCTVRRARTNTPLQALVTLNDPVYIEAAQALARRMVVGGDTAAERVTTGFRLCLARPPSEKEQVQLLALYEQARERFANSPDQARQMAGDPQRAVSVEADAVELAAWTVVGNVLLNLDEMFMKR